MTPNDSLKESMEKHGLFAKPPIPAIAKADVGMLIHEMAREIYANAVAHNIGLEIDHERMAEHAWVSAVKFYLIDANKILLDWQNTFENNNP